MMRRYLFAMCLLCIFLLWMGCSNEPKGNPITLSFQAKVGDQDFACDKVFEGVGADSAKVEFEDFRLFVHNLRLVSSSGKEVPIALKQDGKWQQKNVAMLDFENKKGKCSSGTEETRTRIEGSIPEGTYQGLRFTLGVPFELNHINAFEASAPLNTTSMFWGWQGGFKFLRVDITTEKKEGFIFHLGSIGCELNKDKKVTRCDMPNRPEVKLDNFKPGKSVVLVDLKSLFSKTKLNQNQKDTPGGCMSTPNDSDCQSTFQGVGLSYSGSSAPSSQQLFRLGSQ